MLAVEAHQLERVYPNGRGVQGVDMAVDRGECHALLGRNGSGKSTLTRLLLGLERPTAGELSVLGAPPCRGRASRFRRIGAVLETSVHWENLTGRQNAYFVGRACGLPGDRVEARLGELFGLADLSAQADEPVERYSHGMRRKLSIVEALCHEPELLVLDEPSAGLDAHFLVTLTRLVRERCERGCTSWIASNDPDWTSGVADRVAFVDEGRIVRTGTVDELVAEVAPFREVRMTLAEVTPIPAPPADSAREFAQDGQELTALVEPEPVRVPELMDWVVRHGGSVRRLEVLRSTLRDAFLAATGRSMEG